MIPAAVAAEIGLTIGELRSYVPIASELIAAYRIAADTGASRGIYGRFVGQLNRAGLAMTTATASTVYRAARYFADPGRALSLLPPGAPIDPRLARDLPAFGRYAGEFGAYRAMVSFTITDPETGKSVVKGVWVETRYQPTTDEIYMYARSKLAGILSGSPLNPDHPEEDYYDITEDITDFGRFS